MSQELKELLEKRKEELKKKATPELLPLWLESLSPEVLLTTSLTIFEPWARLLEAKALFDLKRASDSLKVLEEMDRNLPKGLLKMLNELEELIKKGQRPNINKNDELTNWLTKLRQWRELSEK
jgi:hypothetical protein